MTRPQPQVEGIRLQKVLADAGVASRRAAERLIAEGRVSVDGATVTTQGLRIDPERAVVRVDGERIPVRGGLAYLAANKPLGMISTMSDPDGRPCVGDLVADRPERLFHVGRLDADTEGLLLLTNDGSLAHRLAHPSFGVQKVYRVVVSGQPSPKTLRRLREGVELDDGLVAVDRVKLVDAAASRAQLEVVIHVGRNRVVRRLMEEVGHPVTRLVRLEFGPVTLGRLRPGGVRVLTRQETGALLDSVDLST